MGIILSAIEETISGLRVIKALKNLKIINRRMEENRKSKKTANR